MTQQSIDLGTVLHFMRAALRERSAAVQSGTGTLDVQYGAVVESALRRMGQAQLITLPSDLQYGSLDAKVSNQNPELIRLVVEAFHYLLHNGIITRAPNPPNFPGSSNVNSFVITDRGLKWSAGEEPVPEDAKRYMQVLESLVPNLDLVVRQYVEESLVAYQRQAYFAAAVMIGAACEKAVYLLADSFLRSVRDPNEKKKLDEAMQRRSISRLFKSIQELLSAKIKTIPYDVTEGAEQHLLSFLDSVRVQRNEAVHPNAALVTPGKVQLSLAAFPHACEKVFELIRWLDANPI
jgi:hypothetical protein